MTGRRLPDGEWPTQPGDYSKVDGEWFVKPPSDERGKHVPGGSIANHDVVEHEDGTITVSPSILVHPAGKWPGWHGYLERGVWREC